MKKASSSGLNGRLSSSLLKSVLLLSTLSGMSIAVLAQEAPPPPPPESESATPPSQSSSTSTSEVRGQGRRTNFNPEEFRARMMAQLKEQLGVTDDAEWSLITERIEKINELRRSTMVGMGFGMRGMGGQGGQGNRNRGGQVSNAEAESLQSAVKDNAPDAEIKARLTRLREVRKENTAKLEKAQEDLRSVLSVKQEAIVVLMGLIP